MAAITNPAVLQSAFDVLTGQGAPVGGGPPQVLFGPDIRRTSLIISNLSGNIVQVWPQAPAGGLPMIQLPLSHPTVEITMARHGALATYSWLAQAQGMGASPVGWCTVAYWPERICPMPVTCPPSSPSVAITPPSTPSVISSPPQPTVQPQQLPTINPLELACTQALSASVMITGSQGVDGNFRLQQGLNPTWKDYWAAYLPGRNPWLTNPTVENVIRFGCNPDPSKAWVDFGGYFNPEFHLVSSSKTPYVVVFTVSNTGTPLDGATLTFSLVFAPA